MNSNILHNKKSFKMLAFSEFLMGLVILSYMYVNVG